jgi:hypothetical protein
VPASLDLIGGVERGGWGPSCLPLVVASAGYNLQPRPLQLWDRMFREKAILPTEFFVDLPPRQK